MPSGTKTTIRKTGTTEKYLKAKLIREGNQLGSVTTQFKFTAPDGKKRAANMLNHDGIVELAKNFPSKQANRFIKWFTYSADTIDGKSKSKAYALFNSSLLDTIKVGTVRTLQQIRSYLFGRLYDFAGQLRTLNIAKGDFRFPYADFLPNTLKTIEAMRQPLRAIFRDSSFNGSHAKINVGENFKMLAPDSRVKVL